MFRVLYAFSAPELSVVEIEKLGLPEKTPLSEKYKWLLIKETEGKISELQFKGMGRVGKYEFRTFVGGELHFNASEAVLKIADKSYALSKGHLELAPEASDLIEHYLSESP